MLLQYESMHHFSQCKPILIWLMHPKQMIKSRQILNVHQQQLDNDHHFLTSFSKMVTTQQLHRLKATRIIYFRFSLSVHLQMLPIFSVCGFLYAKASFKCFHWPQEGMHNQHSFSFLLIDAGGATWAMLFPLSSQPRAMFLNLSSP